MTSIEWLIEKAKEFSIDLDLLNCFEQAKEMHKQEIIDAYYQCGRDNFEHVKVINRSATEYYQETFVSKGSDECQNFEKMYDTTSATLCANCGKEKFLHKT